MFARGVQERICIYFPANVYLLLAMPADVVEPVDYFESVKMVLHRYSWFADQIV